jgi:pyocin large subunit-like protein
VILQPGDLLYLPQYWFHQMEALDDNSSLSWWFVCTSRKKHGDVAQLKIHPADPLKLAFRRNLEKLFVTLMNNDLASTHNLFCAIASGKVNLPKSLLVAPLDGRSAPTVQEQLDPPPVIPSDIVDNSSSSSVIANPQAWDDVIGRVAHTVAAVLPVGTVAITLRELTAGRFNGLRIS